MIDKHKKAVEIFNLGKEVFNMLNKLEIWKDIKGYEGRYQVSNLGNVKSLNYKRTGEERILKPFKDGDGYLQVTLCKNGKRKTYYVHRLLALTFLPNPENLPCINHKDENSLNNCLYNLEWCTYSYNINYGTRNDRMVETKNKNGSIKAEKPIVQYTKNMIEIGRYKSINEASRQTGINLGNIGSCCKGRYKSAGDYIWKYL